MGRWWKPKSSASSGKERILVLNFFSGILSRGIPLYVDNLCLAFERNGVLCRQMRCPVWFRKLPRPILNFLFVLFEQAVMPVTGIAYDRIIYPYNSVSLIGTFSSKTAVVLHDFISSRRRARSLSARYVRLTQAFYDFGKGDVIYISQSTLRTGDLLHKFSRSRKFVFPNSFFLFMRLVSPTPRIRGDVVLLCSGWGRNKDLAGALMLYLESKLYERRALNILGLAGHTEIVREFMEEHPEVASQITILPQVGDSDVVRAYETARWTWVHSRAEGYGRSIAEARLCGSSVVASNIAPFREQAENETFLYRGLEEFKKAVSLCEASVGPISRRIPPEHDILYAEISRFCGLQ